MRSQRWSFILATREIKAISVLKGIPPGFPQKQNELCANLACLLIDLQARNDQTNLQQSVIEVVYVTALTCSSVSYPQGGSTSTTSPPAISPSIACDLYCKLYDQAAVVNVTQYAL